MTTISILGSGWLGLPLAQHFILKGHQVKASTTSESRLAELSSIKAEPFVLDISTPSNMQTFFQANVLIINIPSKDIEAFSHLTEDIKKSDIGKVLFVSSISVYENNNKTISESDGGESAQNPLFIIENLFRNCTNFQTTIVRFGGLVGYSRHPGKFFSTGRIVQNPDAYVNLIHRDDCIEIISQIVEKEVWSEIFNCCADSHPTKRQFYTQAAQSIGRNAPEFANSGSESFAIISNQKVKQSLKYDFLHPDLMRISFES